MIIVAPLKKMPYAQAKVRRHPNRIELVSYTTIVAEIVGGVLIVHGLYSMTTRRHIGAFVAEYCGLDYFVAKECYTKGLAYDLLEHCFVELP